MGQAAGADFKSIFHRQLRFNQVEGFAAGGLDFSGIRWGKFFTGLFSADPDGCFLLQIFNICIDGCSVLFCKVVPYRYLYFLSIVGKRRGFFNRRRGVHLHIADYPAVRQFDDTVRIIFCKLSVVGYNNDQLFLGQLFQRFQNLPSSIGIQRSGRFVRHNNFRFFHQCPRNCNTLFLSAGQFIGFTVSESLQINLP